MKRKPQASELPRPRPLVPLQGTRTRTKPGNIDDSLLPAPKRTKPNSDVSSTPEELAARKLCKVCGRINWPSHLAKFQRDGKAVAQRWLDLLNRHSHHTKPNWHPKELDDAPGDYSLDDVHNELRLGDLRHVIKAKDSCTLCNLIYRAANHPLSGAKHSVHAEIEKYPDIEPLSCIVHNPFLNLTGSVLSVFLNEPRLDSSIHFSLLGDRWMCDRRSNPRNTTTKFDIDLVTRWWKDCKQHHTRSCKVKAYPGNVSRATIPLRVVNVLTNRVVETPPGSAFVALSYVWGQSSQFRLRKSNFVGQDRFASLDGKDVPQTIADAMSLVKSLGLAYLWVDALCILEDDPDDLEANIRAMHRVYQAADLTIVAAAGSNADSGLLGLRPGTRKIESITGTVEGIDLVLNQVAEYTPSRYVWGTRGWTYQEWLFSRRMLLITEQGLLWDCLGCMRTEDQEYQPEGVYNPDENQQTRSLRRVLAGTQNQRDPFMSIYVDLMNQYTQRHLTHEQDVLNAFSATLEHLSAHNKTRFCWGLPINCFIVALLWNIPATHPSSIAPTERRTALWKNARKFPSWSWAGWRGEAKYIFFDARDAECQTLVAWPWEPAYNLGGNDADDVWETGVLTIEALYADIRYADCPEILRDGFAEGSSRLRAIHGVDLCHLMPRSSTAVGRLGMIRIGLTAGDTMIENIFCQSYILVVIECVDIDPKPLWEKRGIVTCSEDCWSRLQKSYDFSQQIIRLG
ncbi:heterokaryon incompatibility protein-domain-containing protein [Dactylonectria macrodidyma]|uniref:Heterokaryon incompatibility protein-domain-containing protein n=1 Tax=Dactylonectria macrodidyma TaxID=307937 RepID=A0A9P9DHU7_9HYPO|nr:heterokaryon incompatibility protein-domain-containing protein [Dactylonectria macrodidyma]